MSNFHTIIQQQKAFFSSNESKALSFRIKALQKLQTMISTNENKIMNALKKDLQKSEFEAYTTEIGFVLEEIRFTLKHLKKWSKPKRVRTPITHFGAKSYVMKEPYGVALIIAPWNYPFQLAIAPLIGAIAAGNCAIIKPSELTPTTSSLLNQMISSIFPPEYITVIEGDAATSQALLENEFDYIFFTGSVHVGKIIMKAAAKHLTPVTLELGGKSPCIVHHDANVTLAAKRIVWGKLLNAGQTCVAPDYLLVHKKIKEEVIAAIITFIHDFYGDDTFTASHYPKIINLHHLQRLQNMLTASAGTVIFGGKIDQEAQRIEPTLMTNVEWNDAAMEEEIFGPILPIITYSNIEDIIAEIKKRSKPLALYMFTEDRSISKKIMHDLSFGSGCINDTVFQIANPYLPFGGVGTSGTGSYHGKKSFEEFSHEKSMLRQTTFFDIPLRYPNVKNGLKMVRWFMK